MPDGPVEGLDRETCDLPLHHEGGGAAVGVWAGGEGAILIVHEDTAGEVHAVVQHAARAQRHAVGEPLQVR